MDIIDIMLARATTPQGRVETFAKKAQTAATQAAQAQASAQAAIDSVQAAADDITATKTEAQETLATAQSALNDVNTALEELDSHSVDIEAVDAEISKLDLSKSNTNTAESVNTHLIVDYPDATSTTITDVNKMYKSTGNNEDGTMTQKAITAALSTKADTFYVDSAIANIPAHSDGGSSNLGDENDGKLVVVDPDGNITPGVVTEDELIEALIISGGYTAKDAIGLEVDYDNKSFTRTQEAKNLEMGTDFDSYIMYGGRMRCNVSDNGTITAFYGDSNYREDGSNGQVMIYQPKFYYQRIPISTEGNKIGKAVVRDSFAISATAQNGFKLHPIFKTSTDEELDYVLFSAYEGSLFDVSENTYVNTTAKNVDYNNDKLSSVAGAKPLTGSSGLNITRAEDLANHRGAGWHISTLAAESANQLLELIEFGTMNGQTALGKGVCNITTVGDNNQAVLTGATSSLGNASGRAETTIGELNGTTTEYTDEDKVSISYRGMENPWGNTWKMLGGVLVYGNTASNGGIPNICKNYDYSYTNITNNYLSTEFSLPNTSSWVSSLGFGSKAYDWVLMPAECSENANSALPIGDSGWFDSNLTGLRIVVVGGSWSFNESDGPFYYGCDKAPNDSSYKSYGARLMYIPTKNTIYTENITKWQTKMNLGG